MNQSTLILVSLPALWAIATAPVYAQTRTFIYQCEADQTFQVTYSEATARLTLSPDETLLLPRVVSRSGIRYADERTTLFLQGNEAFLEVAGQRLYNTCVGAEAASTESETPEVITYECSDGTVFQAAYFSEIAELTLGDRAPMTLTRTPSASGVRYSDEQTTLFTQGGEALIEVDGEILHQNCLIPADAMLEEERILEQEQLQESSREDAPATPAVPALW